VWMHGEFLILKERRIGKSEGNAIRVQDIIDKGFNPFAYRYLALGAHYRSKLSFSIEALEGAQNSLDKLYNRVREMKTGMNQDSRSMNQEYQDRFLQAINNDMAMPKALAIVWEVIKDSDLRQDEKYVLLLDFDRVLGLGFDKIKPVEIPDEVQRLAEKREECRQGGDFQKADELRKKIEKMGFEVEDTEYGPKISKR